MFIKLLVLHVQQHPLYLVADYATRLKNQILNSVPYSANSIHFCCDRYWTPSTKDTTRSKRIGNRVQKLYEVGSQYNAPDPRDFFSSNQNKYQLLMYLSNYWSDMEKERSFMGSRSLYIGGGFQEMSKSVVLMGGTVSNVHDLESTQEEADTRIILHTIYSINKDAAKRVIVHANDTDVITLCIYYYASTLMTQLDELWVKAGPLSYLPIHEITKSLQPPQCKLLPFLHSFSGRDTTSHPYFTSEKGWFIASTKVNTSALEAFGENGQFDITDELINQARDLIIAIYSKSNAIPGMSLSDARGNIFLTNKATLLKLLPPTEISSCCT